MPELPEVETSLRGISPHLLNQKVVDVIIRHPHLRWPIPANLKSELIGQSVNNMTRRGKYLLLSFASGTLIIHLGMSGRLCVLEDKLAPKQHDHVDICFANHKTLRFTDPRRFGAVLFTKSAPETHPLLAHIGPEPLTKAFNGDYLWKRAQGKTVAIKSFIMNGQIVAGVGNIYAVEALFAAGIHPKKPAGKVTHEQYQILATAIKMILRHAIKKGGTTLKDFMKPSGKPGYFSIELKVYGKAGQPCPRCKTPLSAERLGQRNTFYCAKCQR